MPGANHDLLLALASRAQLASWLAKRVLRGRRRLYSIKHACLEQLARLAPETMRLSIDHTSQIGLPTIAFLPTGQRFHITWDVEERIVRVLGRGDC